MLERLHIRDLALVERLDVEFGPGLNVITGETGAGKSLLVDSLSLLLGGRADATLVRAGAKRLRVEGEFRVREETAEHVRGLLEEWGFDPGGETLVLSRELFVEGRSRASVNQSPVTLASLKRIGERLADLHGQHEHQSLLREGAALATLDRLAGLEEERARCAEAVAALREARGELERLRERLATHAERRDYLLHAAAELDEAGLREGEEDELRIEAARLAHADRLRSLAGAALERLSEGDTSAGDGLGAAAHVLDQAVALDPSLAGVREAVHEASIVNADAARELGAYLGALDADPASLERIEARRESYARLTRKYRRGVTELNAWREELRAELSAGEDAEGTLSRAQALVEDAAARARSLAAALSHRRASGVKTWNAALSRELGPLGFPHARIAFAVSALPAGEPQANGMDHVELGFSANPGEPLRPLAKIASGGELSRVMLALKCALQAPDRVDLLVFDEVDSGIGGAVAEAVGERLRRLAEHRQVLCVTHLPMIAARASLQFAVSKHVVSGRTTARIAPLDATERIEELARMLAGARVTDTTRRQARELIAGAPEAVRPTR